MCKYTKIFRCNLISTTHIRKKESTLISMIQFTGRIKNYCNSTERKIMPKNSENIVGFNFNLNLDNIRSHTFKIVQFTVDLSQNNNT